MASNNDLRKVSTTMDCTALRALYRAFRTAALNDGETAESFDDHCVWEANNRQFTKGIRHEVLIVDAAATQAGHKLHIRTVQRSNETEEWGGFLSGDLITDTRPGDAFLASHGWPV